MASNTSRLNLRKPDATDRVNVTTDLSDNYDKIDAGTALVGHAHSGTYELLQTGTDNWLRLYARTPDLIIVGVITRDANEAATSAPVLWPDGSPGTYTATTLSTAFPGAVDAYTVTYGSPVTKTVTQSAVTRDAAGAVTNRPAMSVA